MLIQALPEVDIYRDYGQSNQLVLEEEGFQASWEWICKRVNSHNDLHTEGKSDYLLRVFCPWDGELHIPLKESGRELVENT